MNSRTDFRSFFLLFRGITDSSVVALVLRSTLRGSGLAGGVFREERGPFREKENFGQEIVITFPL